MLISAPVLSNDVPYEGNLILVESASDSLALWEKKRPDLPLILVLFSHHPGLDPVAGDNTITGDKKTYNEDHPSSSDMGPVNPVTTRNYIQLAVSRKLVREIFWVVPQIKSLTEDYGGYLKALFASMGQKVSLKYSEGVFRGTAAGVPISISSIANLPTFSLPVLVDIHLDYLTKLYDNPVQQTPRQLIGTFVKTLSHRNLTGNPGVISRIFPENEVSAEFFYWADFIADLWNRPDSIDRNIWEGLDELIYLEFFFQPITALQLTDAILKDYADHPAVLYHRALNFAYSYNFDRYMDPLLTSMSNDPVYRYGGLQLARYLVAKRQPNVARDLLEVLVTKFPDFKEADAVLKELITGNPAPPENLPVSQ
jgi:hypothetical protein